MNPLDALAATDIDPALLMQIRALVEQQQAKLAEKDFKNHRADAKLAYYERVHFGKASEALVGEQRLLSDETVDTDLAAIDEELQARAPVKTAAQAGRLPATATALGAHRAPL